MNFFGVGPAELVVILVVALVFVGPERLPRLAADLARTIREIRKYTGSLAAEFNEVIQDFEKETVGDRSQWAEIGEGLTGATRSVTEAIRGARADAAGATLAAELAAARSPAAGTEGAAPPTPLIEEADWREIPEPPAAPADAPAADDAAQAEVVPSTHGQAPVQTTDEPR
jgi:sec-independent protein translocase protein TatB